MVYFLIKSLIHRRGLPQGHVMLLEMVYIGFVVLPGAVL